MSIEIRVRSLCMGASLASIALVAPAQAGTIVGWNTNNVVVGPTVGADQTGASVIYNADVQSGVGSATSSGQVIYTAPEANTPGLKVVNGDFTYNKNSMTGCIMASSVATCNSPFQSGKRFKNQVTASGPIDFVFDVDPDGVPEVPGGAYQVFHRMVNVTGREIGKFDISLGFGVGDNFVASTANDGLSFDPNFRFGPEDAAVYTQFPFGLFGDAANNPNFTLDGFFAPERTGYSMSFSEDVLTSQGLFGPYGDIFGNWISQEDVPQGAFWEFDPNKDPLLVAWLNEDGMWEQRRDLDQMLEPFPLASPLLWDSFQELQDAFSVALFADAIEDLSNLNVNYAIALGDVGFTNFTLRVNTSAVPVPGALPLMLAGLAGLGSLKRRRKAD